MSSLLIVICFKIFSLIGSQKRLIVLGAMFVSVNEIFIPKNKIKINTLFITFCKITFITKLPMVTYNKRRYWVMSDSEDYNKLNKRC